LQPGKGGYQPSEIDIFVETGEKAGERLTFRIFEVSKYCRIFKSTFIAASKSSWMILYLPLEEKGSVFR
jgi:hypothetical protein